MCKCTPMIKSPYCGKGDCQMPKHVKELMDKLVPEKVRTTMTDNEINETVRVIIEDIQKAQVDAGGRFMRQNEIAVMKVEDLLNRLVPNNVQFNIYHKSSSPFHDKGD